MKFLFRVLKIREGEGSRLFRFTLLFFLLISALIIGKTARDTLFLSRFNPDYLPIMFVIAAAIVALTVALYTRMGSRFARVPFFMWTGAAFAASLLLMQLLLSKWMYPLLYVWMEVIGTIMIPQFWILANGAFTTRQAKRLFGIIGSGGAMANTLAGFSIRPLVRAYGTDLLLVAAAALIGLSVLTVMFIRKYVSQEQSLQQRYPVEPGTKPSRTSGLSRSSYLKAMTVTIGISASVAALIDYQLKITASQSLSEVEMATIFGIMYGVVGVLSILMQFFVTSRFIIMFGILPSLLALPFTLAVGSTLILLNPVILSTLIARTGDLIFRFTITETSHQLLWLPVAPRQKAWAKPFIDGTVKNSAQGLAGLVILGMVAFFDLRALSWLAIALIAVWIVTAFRLKKEYVEELKKAIEKRRLDFQSLEIDYTDPLIVSILQKALTEGDEHQQLFALDSIKDLPLTPWSQELRDLFQSGSSAVRRKILELARSDPSMVTDREILVLIESGEDGLGSTAMIVCGQRQIQSGLPVLRRELESSDPNIRAAAAAGILLMNKGDVTRAKEVLDAMLFERDRDTKIAALSGVGHFPSLVSDDGIVTLLDDDSSEVRRLAIGIAGTRNSPIFIPHLVGNLAHSVTSLLARKALNTCDPRLVTAALLERLHDTKIEESLSVNIIRCLSQYPLSGVIDELLSLQESASEEWSGEIIDSLLKLSRQIDYTNVQLERATKVLMGQVSQIYVRLALLLGFQKEEHTVLIQDMLNTALHRGKTRVFKLSLLPFPDLPAETFLHTIQSGDPAARANVLEILDNLLARDVRERIVPLFEELALEEQVKRVPPTARTSAPSKEEALINWVNSGGVWPSAVALDYILANRIEHLLTGRNGVNINWIRMPDSPIHQEIISKAWSKDDSILSTIPDFPKERFIMEEVPMYSTLEKTIFLKGVDLFHDIPGEYVSHVAQIAHEDHFDPDEMIFKEGDSGDSMFIIMDGKVRIHKSQGRPGDEKEIAVLTRGEFIGEMALLDREPRSASATATEETVLLRIYGEDFYDLMASRMEIMQGIVKVLTGRLREAIA